MDPLVVKDREADQPVRGPAMDSSVRMESQIASWILACGSSRPSEIVVIASPTRT
jgi:hypothetical protein